MNLPEDNPTAASTREWSRVSSFRELTMTYEGDTEVLALRQPDISPRGMFISTAARFQEGAILKISFRLTRSNHAVSARGEVRYCLPGVGVGIEFVGMAPEDQKAIREEIRAVTRPRSRRRSRAR